MDEDKKYVHIAIVGESKAFIAGSGLVPHIESNSPLDILLDEIEKNKTPIELISFNDLEEVKERKTYFTEKNKYRFMGKRKK